MSKRGIFPQQNGERKKAKLDISISDHNFPLSQNAGPSRESNQTDTWGDDQDDEILLLASQACEDAYINDISLPDYSLCMQPPSTSTQFDAPSSSKTNFTFKKPSAGPANVISTSLKDKCSRISSPLPGISSKMTPNMNNVNVSDDLIFNDKICKGDAGYVYKQLLQLQEENAKLKSENGKLLEKCVTKEGEASILRTQLKSCQVAVDNARLEKIKGQEKVQMEWTEKLSAANAQMHDLRNQLDFKNLEIISIKERCKMLESNKVKLTQVTVPHNDISSSHRNTTKCESVANTAKRVKTISNAAQTEDKAVFITLHKTYRAGPSKLTSILPLVLEPTTEHHSLLEYNEKLQKHTDLSQNKCRIYSTFHRLPTTPTVGSGVKRKVVISSVYEDLTVIAKDGLTRDRLCNVLAAVKTVLTEVQNQLELIAHKMTTAFQKEMDEKYMETTATFVVVKEHDLLSGKSLYKEEQAILARRMVAILTCLLRLGRDNSIDYAIDNSIDEGGGDNVKLIDVIDRICSLLDSTSCAPLYSGLLLSLLHYLSLYPPQISTMKSIISSRPLLPVACAVLAVISRSVKVDGLCSASGAGNLRLDYDQGVLLFKKDSCHLQVLLKQIEAALKCVERQHLVDEAISTAQSLLSLYTHFNNSGDQDKIKCNCQLVLMQVLVYCLRICALMLTDLHTKKQASTHSAQLWAVCRSGTVVLYQCSARDGEWSPLGYEEGHLTHCCRLLREIETQDAYVSMLSEIASTFHSYPECEDMTSYHRQPWISSFDKFSITD